MPPPPEKVHPTHNVNTNININFLTAIDAEASADKNVQHFIISTIMK